MTRKNTDLTDYTAPQVFTEQTGVELAHKLMDIMTDPMPPTDEPDRYWWRMEIQRIAYGATDADVVALLTQICLVHGLPDEFRTELVDEWVEYVNERRGY